MSKAEQDDVKILYICDGKKCDNCSEECFHTSDIRHAASFHETEPNLYVQNIIQLSQPIDMTNAIIEVEIKEESED